MYNGSVLERVFDALTNFDGVDMVALSHEGLLYRYRGSVEEAEAMSATMSEYMSRVRKEYGELKYFAVALGDELVVGFMLDRFLLLARGAEKVMRSYIPVVTRLVSGDVVKCGFCGANLDAYAYQCPGCGKRYPFTLSECPFCGYRSVRRSCPSCGKPIDYRGQIIKPDLTPLYSFSVASAIYGIIMALLSPGNTLLIAVGVGSILGVGMLVTALMSWGTRLVRGGSRRS